MKTRLAAACIAAALSACTVGPNYVRPSVATPEAWRIDYPKAAEVANTKWWQQFGDPVLDELIETALRDNRDLRIAAARVDQFIGALTATGSQLYPQIGYGADAQRARASAVGVPPLPPGANPYFSLYNVSLGAAWQADLFGRVRRQTEAAQAQVYASEQGQRGVVLTLVAGVATSYIVLRALDRQLEIARATAANFSGTQRIFDARFKAGLVAKTEVMQIRSQLQQALAAIPQFDQAIATQENLISILLGRNPGPIARGKTIDELIAPLVPGDLPAAVLQRRPDILAAEQNLVAANANIGAARALYYPNLSLSAALATTATTTGALFGGPAAAGLIAAGLTGPIFTFGAIEGQVAAAEAGERQALAAYQQIVLSMRCAKPTTRSAARASANWNWPSSASASRRCASSRGCRGCASTAASAATSRCWWRRTSCSPPRSRRSACSRRATRSWSTSTRRWAAAGSTSPRRWRHSRRARRARCRARPSMRGLGTWGRGSDGAGGEGRQLCAAVDEPGPIRLAGRIAPLTTCGAVFRGLDLH